MGREFELKYAASEDAFAALKAEFPELTSIAMETTYYDSPDGTMGRLHWTFRRRMENGRSVCTLKTPMAGLGRAEWEVECPDILRAVDLLYEAGAPKQLLLYTAGGVQESCGARFTRLAGLIPLADATVELALDEGVLTGAGRELPFREVEVELKEGSEEAAVAFGEALALRFGLIPEYRSKVARARGLAGLQ